MSAVTTVTTTDHAAVIRRILDMLQADPTLKKQVNEWRFGELPERTSVNDPPTVYVTTASSPQVSRESYGVSAENGHVPIQKVVYEYYVVIVSDPGAEPADAQRQVYGIQKAATAVIYANTKLRRPGASITLEDGSYNPASDPLAVYTDVYAQPRLTDHQGSLVESMTLILRVTAYEGVTVDKSDAGDRV